MFHAQIAQRAFNTPLLVEPSKAMAFLAGLGPRIAGQQLFFSGHALSPDDIAHAARRARAGILINDLAEIGLRNGRAPFALRDSVAVIEISGVLVHRGAWIGQSSGQTSYEGIAAQIAAAAVDPAIRGIALDIDSFGGEVAGVFDLADAIRAARAQKPVRAFVAEHAFSAGYALAAQADRIILPRTGAVGSIGVVVMHADMSGRLQDEGVTVTLVHSGAHKVDANPYTPLPEAVRASIQAEIDALRGLFAETVTAGRGARLSHEAALATEAEIYRGGAAVNAGLADEVSDLAGAFAGFVAETGGRRTISGAMSGRAERFRPTKEGAMRAETTETEHQEPAATPEPEAANSAEPQAAAAPITAPDAASSRAEIEARVRAEAAEITHIAAQAARLGVTVDAAAALREGRKPDALRAAILEQAAAEADARDVVANAPPPSGVAPKESPIIAAAKRSVAANTRP